VAFYHVGPHGGQVEYRLAEGGHEVLVATDLCNDPAHVRNPGAAIWNRDTGSSLILDTWIRKCVDYVTYAYSPDGRYLAMQNGPILIWDLTQLNGQATYEPTRTIRRPGVYWPTTELRFRDNTLLEGRKLEYGEVYLWDVTTGEQLFYGAISVEQCSDAVFINSFPQPSLAAWQCEWLLTAD